MSYAAQVSRSAFFLRQAAWAIAAAATFSLAQAEPLDPGTVLIGSGGHASGLTNIVAISARSSPLFLRSDSTVVGLPGNASNVMALAAGYTHNLVLMSDGSVRQWAPTNMPPVPLDLTNAIAIAAGSYFNCALRSDGTVTAWGRQFRAATNVPAGLTNVVAIAAGYDHVLALSGNGALATWGGHFGYGLPNIPAGATNIAFIAALGNNSIAATSNGIVWRWGEGYTAPSRVDIGRRLKQMAATRTDTFLLEQAGNLLRMRGVFWAPWNPWNVTNLAGIFGSESNLYAIARGPVLRWSPYSPPQYPPTVESGGYGENWAFAVTAESYHPFTYQWYFNGGPLSGATDRLLRLTGLRSTNSGTYFAMVTNAYGTRASCRNEQRHRRGLHCSPARPAARLYIFCDSRCLRCRLDGVCSRRPNIHLRAAGVNTAGQLRIPSAVCDPCSVPRDWRERAARDCL